MNYTKAKIFNIALKNLGVTIGVQSTEQTDRNTSILNEFYEIAKEKVLSDYDWGFASSYRELSLTLNESLNPKFLFEYDYPNDCVALREVVGLRGEERIEFEVGLDGLQKVIYTNRENAKIRYTKLISDEGNYTPEFALALSWYLAFLSAKSITGARLNTSDCYKIYVQMINEAKVRDANEGYIKGEDECNWFET